MFTHTTHFFLRNKYKVGHVNTAYSMALVLKIVHNVWINRGWSRGVRLGVRGGGACSEEHQGSPARGLLHQPG